MSAQPEQLGLERCTEIFADLIAFCGTSEGRDFKRNTEAKANVSIERVRQEIEFFEHSQDEMEFAEMMGVIRGSHSLLEIGSRFGGTLRRMAQVLAPGSMVVAVDCPLIDGTPAVLDPYRALCENAEKIVAMGHAVQVGIGDSHSTDIVESVRSFGPYDFAFIDADHSYEGVKADWENYGPMAKIVAFHDVGGGAEGCVRFWREIKPHFLHREIFNDKGMRRLGIGIIFREDSPQWP